MPNAPCIGGQCAAFTAAAWPLDETTPQPSLVVRERQTATSAGDQQMHDLRSEKVFVDVKGTRADDATIETVTLPASQQSGSDGLRRMGPLAGGCHASWGLTQGFAERGGV